MSRPMVTYFLNQEVQMYGSTDEDEQALASAGQTLGVQAVREGEEIADAIDRMIEEGGRDSPEQPKD